VALIKALRILRWFQVEFHCGGPRLLSQLKKASGGVHVAGGANGDKQLTVEQSLVDLIQVKGDLTKPYDVWAESARQLAAGAYHAGVARLGPRVNCAGVDAPHLEQLAMHVAHLFTAGLLMQVVYVLRDQAKTARALSQLSLITGQGNVGLIGSDWRGARITDQLPPTIIVKAMY
jgi:hypothetical protein